MSRPGRDDAPDRLYTLTGGRTRSGPDTPFDLVTLVVAECDPVVGMQSEHAAILRGATRGEQPRRIDQVCDGNAAKAHAEAIQHGAPGQARKRCRTHALRAAHDRLLTAPPRTRRNS